MVLQYDGASRAQLREALEAYGLAPNKGLGQNFYAIRGRATPL